MAMPPDQMLSMIKAQKDNATPGGVPPAPISDQPTGMSDTSAAPMAAPMSTPEPKMGNREGALINLGIANDMLEQSLSAIGGAETPEGQKVLNAIRIISGIIGPRKGKTNDLQQSEILQLLQTLPQAGGASPEQKAMAGAPLIPGMTPPGAPPAPGGMPPPGAGAPTPSGGGLPPPM